MIQNIGDRAKPRPEKRRRSNISKLGRIKERNQKRAEKRAGNSNVSRLILRRVVFLGLAPAPASKHIFLSSWLLLSYLYFVVGFRGNIF